MSKQRQENQTLPKGIIPQSIVRNGITWICVSVDIELNQFTFKSSDGREFVRKWNELTNILTR